MFRVVTAGDTEACGLDACLSRFFGERGEEFSLRAYKGAAELLSGHEAGADLVFLERGTLGADACGVAQKLRALDAGCRIVLAAGIVRDAGDCFAAGINDFVLLPVLYPAFLSVMDRAVRYRGMIGGAAVTLRAAGGDVNVPVREIVSLEARPGRVTYRCAGGEIRTRESFRGALSALPEESFAQVSRRAAVGLCQVTGVDREQVAAGGTVFRLREEMREPFMKKLAAYLSLEAGERP